MKRKTLLSWSSGKDSAWALHVLRQSSDIDLIGLFTVVNEKHNRVSMHAVRMEVLKLQAEAVGLPLQTIFLPDPCSNKECDAIMQKFTEACARTGIECIAFGDLYLEDVRQYREEQLKGTGIKPLFPLWNIQTSSMANEMLSEGVEAYITCIDPKKLSPGFAGWKWSKSFIDQLPATADPCGENGEFHTVVVDGPMFQYPLDIDIGESVKRNGFIFTDIKIR
jgi:uncharacterized protein (TIGR00290 family)